MQLISEKTIQDIESSLGLEFLSEEERSQIMKDIIAIICNRAGLRIIKEFTEEETKEFNQIPETSFEEMENYILAKNPRAMEIFEEEAQKTKEEILQTKA